jgi:hypothetical protein
MTYNRPAEVSSGSDSGLGPALPGGPDPRAPQTPPGVVQSGKNFARRDYLLTNAPRSQDAPVAIGPGSGPWRQGSDDVLNKRSYMLRDVTGPRRRQPK